MGKVAPSFPAALKSNTKPAQKAEKAKKANTGPTFVGVSEEDPPARTFHKRGTGFISADQVQKMLAGNNDDDDDGKRATFDVPADHDEDAPKMKARGTGFINPSQFQKLVADHN